MNTAFYSDPLERNIVEEILQWSSTALQKPSKFFNNLPPCPFAKKAWSQEKVAIIFKKEDSYQTLWSCISKFNDDYDLAIVVDTDYKKGPEDFHDYLDQLNDVISNGMFIDKDIWLMGFHPEDEANDLVEEVSIDDITGTDYAMIFVQRLSKLQEAADKLNKKGYYDSYDKDYDVKEIYEKRNQLYRRLKNGYETA
tara:strand:- start:789 stop:1376 length:588 start_codon:yes stop_codon:yes gene_type:complete